MIRIKKILSSCFALVIGICLFSTPAFATDTTGAYITKTYDGVSYQAHTSTGVFFGVVTGGTYANASSTRPAGYIGASTLDFNGSGSIVTSRVQYSQKSTSSIGVIAAGDVGSGNRFFTEGTVHVYRPSGSYSSFSVPASPYATISVDGLAPSGVTADGLTYGSKLDCINASEEDQYDLYSVVGLNGQNGYILNDDYIAATVASCPNDALTAFSIEHDEILPVYNLNGEVIDSFVVHCGGDPQYN